MISFRVRPRIKRYTNNSVEEVIDCFDESLHSNDFELDGTLLKNHIIVKIPEDIIHYWSPELQLEINENFMKDDKFTDHRESTMIRGFIGPKSTVWTMFMFLYIVFGLLTLFGTVLGSSQQMLDMPPEGYWYALLGGIGLVITLIASQVGQRMGQEQTEMLMHFIETAFKKCDCC
jgi:hypothetical protein